MRSMVEGSLAPTEVYPSTIESSLNGPLPTSCARREEFQSFASMNFSTTGAILSRHLRPLKMP